MNVNITNLVINFQAPKNEATSDRLQDTSASTKERGRRTVAEKENCDNKNFELKISETDKIVFSKTSRWIRVYENGMITRELNFRELDNQIMFNWIMDYVKQKGRDSVLSGSNDIDIKITSDKFNYELRIKN